MFWKSKKTKKIEELNERLNAIESKPNDKASSIYDLGLSEEIEALDKFISDHAMIAKQPHPSYPDGTAMDSMAASPTMNSSAGFVNPRAMKYYVSSSSFLGYYNMAIVAQHWLIMRGCSWKAKEAVKKWFEVSLNSDEKLEPSQIKFIESCNKAYKLRENLVQAETFKNIFGVRHILFKHKDPNFDYSTPFNPDAFKDGNYAGMAQIDPYWIMPFMNNDDLTDPTRINFYEPEIWHINGKDYHRSHFVILTGEPVADYLKPTYRYGGAGMVQRVYERVYAAESTANETPQLAKNKRNFVQKVNIAEKQANKLSFKKTLAWMAQVADNFGVRVIGKDDEFEQLDTSLTDLDQAIMNQYQLVCAEFGIPASKLLGTGHGGFSTGETDDDYWIQGVEELQGNEYQEIIDAHLARLIPSELERKIGVSDDLCVKWNPLKVMSDAEIATVRLTNAQADVAWINTGAIDATDIRQRITKDKNSGFDGIELRETDYELDDDKKTTEI